MILVVGQFPFLGKREVRWMDAVVQLFSNIDYLEIVKPNRIW